MDTTKFIESVKHLLDIENEKIKQADLRGENYNIFDVVNLTTDEVKLHSSFIADLLSPYGKHGLGTKPLELFLEIIGVNANKEELSECLVEREYHIGPISEDYSEGGNIDILIRLHKQIIVIENKIYAGDQRKQMVRYNNFAKRWTHRLLYLTLDGHEPSEDSSFGLKNNKDYFCISYAVEIHKWLNDILILSINRPLVRETIQQYLKIIKQLTNQDMEETERADLFKAMDQNPGVVQEIINSQWEYRRHIVLTYIIEPLKEHFIAKGFEWYEDENFRDQSKESGFGIRLPDWEKFICIEFEKYDFNTGFYGVWDPRHRGSESPMLVGNKSTAAWPYGWEYLKYSNWSISHADEIVNGNVYKYILRIFEDLYYTLSNNQKSYPMD